MKKNSSGEPVVTKRTREKTTKSRQKWTDTEVKLVLEKMKGTIKSGKQIERPNARAYYNEIALQLKLDNRDGSSIRNKINNLKQEYDKAVKWTRETGQGVGDTESVTEHVKKICLHFDDLDEIYHSRVTIHPPYQCDSMSKENIQAATMSDGDDDESSNEQSPRNSISKPKKPKCSPTSDVSILVGKRQEVQLKQTEVEAKRIEQDAVKLDFEREIWQQKVQFEQKKLQESSVKRFEKYEYKRELLKFEHTKFERELELEKFRIEQEMKLKLELAKLGKQA